MKFKTGDVFMSAGEFTYEVVAVDPNGLGYWLRSENGLSTYGPSIETGAKLVEPFPKEGEVWAGLNTGSKYKIIFVTKWEEIDIALGVRPDEEGNIVHAVIRSSNLHSWGKVS